MPASRRSYTQHCGLAARARPRRRSGGRCSSSAIPPRSPALRRSSAGLEGITTNLLAQASPRDEGGGARRARREGPEARALPMFMRSPTRGLALEPAVMELARWGVRHLLNHPRRGDRRDIGWALLSMKRRYLKQLGLRCRNGRAGSGGSNSSSAGEHLGVLERPSERAGVETPLRTSRKHSSMSSFEGSRAPCSRARRRPHGCPVTATNGERFWARLRPLLARHRAVEVRGEKAVLGRA